MPRAEIENTTSAPADQAGFYLHIGSEPPGPDTPLIIDMRGVQPTARRALEETVELLIAALDELDAANDDLEDDTEDGCAFEDVVPSHGAQDPDDSDDEPDVDGEPWLGSIEVGIEWGETWEGVQSYVRVGIDQRDWASSGDRDLEAEHDGREPQGDEEPDSDSEPDTDAEADFSDAEPSFCGVTAEDPMHGLAVGHLVPTKKKRRHSDASRLVDYDPNNLPEKYAQRVSGDCMFPEIKDGELLIYDRTEPCRPGDLIAFYRRRELIPRGEHQSLVKRLVSPIPEGVTFPWTDRPGEISPAFLVAMNNPPVTFPVYCRDVIAVHRCLGVAAPGTSRPMSAAERSRLRVTKGMPAI